MADARSAWNEAGERLQGLGASLKQHHAQRREADVPPEDKPVADAFARVGEALQGAFDALASAAKDPVVEDQVKETGKSVAEALAATFTEVSEGMRKAFDSGNPGPTTTLHTPQDDPPQDDPPTEDGPASEPPA